MSNCNDTCDTSACQCEADSCCCQNGTTSTASGTSTDATSTSGKTTVTLRFKREALLYDIAQMGYVEGDVQESENPHTPHQTQDIVQDGNVDRVTRVLSLAWSVCQELLRPYTKEETAEDIDLSDDLEEPEEYVIKMSVPSGFSKTTAYMLRNLVHEYLVCRALGEWLSVTKPAAADAWYAKAAAAMNDIEDSLSGIEKVTERPLSPW